MPSSNPRYRRYHARVSLRRRVARRGDPCAICGKPIDYTLPGDPRSQRPSGDSRGCGGNPGSKIGMTDREIAKKLGASRSKVHYRLAAFVDYLDFIGRERALRPTPR